MLPCTSSICGSIMYAVQDVTRCTHFVVLYLCPLCQCGLHVLLWSHIGLLMCLLAAEPHSTAGHLFPSQCLSGMILLTLCLMVWDCQVSTAGPMPFIGLAARSITCLLLFSLSFLSFYWLVLRGWGLRTDRALMSLPSLALPAFLK